MKYICVSGGADSTAMALLLWERGEDFEMVFSDTGAELPETYWILPRLSQKTGSKLNVVSNGSFFQKLTHRGYLLPSFNRRWCTSDLKIASQEYYFDANNILSCEVGVGIAVDEPNRIRDKWYPLVEANMSKSDAKKLCQKHDLISPVYDWRTSVSCFCCPFQRKRDWKNLYKHHPILYVVAEEWEKQSMEKSNGFTWNKGFNLREMRTATNSQIEMWPEPEHEPCLICNT